MSTPWQLKRYEDLVFVQPGVVGNDGRSHLHPDDNYGRGGILTDKKFMISSTWNAPKTALTVRATSLKAAALTASSSR